MSVQEFYTTKKSEYYATKQDWSVTFGPGGKEITIPLYRVEDGKIYGEKQTPIVFPRLGEYNVKTIIKTSLKNFTCRWRPITEGLEIEQCSWRELPSCNVSVCSERVACLKPGVASEVSIGQNRLEYQQMTVSSVLIIIEHLEA